MPTIFAHRLANYVKGRSDIGMLPPGIDRLKLRTYVAKAMSRYASSARSGFWEHQEETFQAVTRRFSDATRQPKGIVVIPTGGGKTTIFLGVMDAVSNLLPNGRRVTPTTVVLVPTLHLVDQTAAALRAQHPHLADVVGIVASDVSGEASALRGVRPVTIMSYEGFVQRAIAGEMTPADLHLLVMDEAHRALSDLRQDVFAPFLNAVPTLAFSATPSFDETKSLYDLFGADAEVANVPAARLRADGVIAPAVNYVLRVTVEGEMPDDPVLAELVRRSAVVKGLKEFWDEHDGPGEGGPLRSRAALAFLKDTEHSTMAMRLFNAGGEEGPVAGMVSGYDDRDVQASSIADLRAGVTSPLFNSRFLGEGADIPEVGAVLCGPSGSAVQVVQMGGRAVRFDPRIPKDHPGQVAIIVNTELVVEGRTFGQPVPYWKALDDFAIARPVAATPLSVEELLASVTGVPDVDDRVAAARARAAERLLAERLGSETASTPPPAIRVEVIEADPTGQVDPPAGAPSGGVPDGPDLSRYEPHSSRYGVSHRVNLSAALASRALRRTHADHLDAFAMAKRLGTRRDAPDAEAFFDAFEAEFVSARALDPSVTSVNYGMHAIPATLADDGTVIYPEEAVELVSYVLERPIRLIDDDWALRVDLVRGKWRTGETLRMFDDLETEFLEKRRAGTLHRDPIVRDRAIVRDGRKGEPMLVAVSPVTIRADLRIVPLYGKAVCYHRDCWLALRRLTGMASDAPIKDTGWVDRREMAALLGGRSPRTDAMFRRLEEAFVQAERDGVEDLDLDLGGRGVRVGRRATSSTSKPVCYAVTSLGAMRGYLGIPDLAGPADDEMNYRQLCRALGTNGSTNMALRSLREEILRQCGNGEAPSVGGVLIDAGMRRRKSTEGLYFGPDSPGQIRGLLADPGPWAGSLGRDGIEPDDGEDAPTFAMS